MLITEIIREFKDVTYETVDETSVDALGLCDYGPDKNYCCFVTQEKYLSDIKDNAVVVISKKDFAKKLMEMGKGVIIVDSPKNVFFRVHEQLCQREVYRRPCFQTEIGKNCSLSSTAIIAKKNVKIGDHVFIDDHVVIKENVVIESNVVIRAGSIIGGQNYQIYQNNGVVKCATHVGGVKIDSAVDIGYNVTIGKGLYPWDDTIVGENTMIADLSALGHGCKIGKRSFIGVCAVINGRALIGDNVKLGPGVIISNGIHVNNNGFATIGSVVLRDMKEKQKVFGNPARAMFIE